MANKDGRLHSFGELAELIRERYAAMSPQFQSAARFLLDQAEEAAVSSMRSVAAQAGVQPPTLVRFAQSLGFAGWPELRRLCVAQLRSRPEPYAARARTLVQRDEPRDLMMAEMFHAHRMNLDSTQARNREVLPRAARLLERARTVHVAGFRACYPIAFGFMYVYRLFRPTVALLSAEAGTLEMQLRALAKGDAALVISFAPYSHEARIVADAAREAGSRVIALTDSALAPIALAADATLLFAVSSPSFFPSTVAGMAVAESLLEILVSRAGNDAIARIESSERRLFASGAYEKAARRRPQRTRSTRASRR
jgi:DNA-binding MurR/RpiR family transcriptional regulator